MLSRIWEPQEPGQPPLSSQDLIGLVAGTGWALRPLFPHHPGIHAASPGAENHRKPGPDHIPPSAAAQLQAVVLLPTLSSLARFGYEEQCDMQPVGLPK